MSDKDINNLKEMLVDFNEYSTDYTKTRCRELEETIENTLKEIEKLNKRIKELEDGFKASTEDLCEASIKIEKAIEYIKEYGDITSMFVPTNIRYETAKELLEILEGSK